MLLLQHLERASAKYGFCSRQWGGRARWRRTQWDNSAPDRSALRSSELPTQNFSRLQMHDATSFGHSSIHRGSPRVSVVLLLSENQSVSEERLAERLRDVGDREVDVIVAC